MALTLQQIKQIITYTYEAEATAHYRDLWFFSYLCNGININDMPKLKYANILASFEKEERIKNAAFLTNFGD